MTEHKIKLVKELAIKNLKETYPITRGKEGIVNNLQKAIDDGVLAALVEKSAVENLNGDTLAAYKAMKNCLGSYSSRLSDKISMDLVIERILVDTLRTFIKEGIDANSKSSSIAKVVVDRPVNRPRWDWDDNEDFMQYADNWDVLQSIYDCISSKISHLDNRWNDDKEAALDRKLCMQRDKIVLLRKDYRRRHPIQKKVDTLRSDIERLVLETEGLEAKIESGKIQAYSKPQVGSLQAIWDMVRKNDTK